jgi:PAS domain S-box-containing protein
MTPRPRSGKKRRPPRSPAVRLRRAKKARAAPRKGKPAAAAPPSASRQIEDASGKAETRFRKLFESNTVGLVIADLAGRTLEANDAYLRMLQYSREDLSSGAIQWDERTPQEYRALDTAAIDSLRSVGIAFPWEKELTRKDGTRVPVLIGVTMLDESQGTCIAFVQDLTDRKRAEDSRARLAAIVESSEDAIIGWTLGGIVTSWNAGAEKMYGYASSEAVGKTVSFYIPPEKANEAAHIFERIKRGEGVQHLETVRIRKDGRPVEVSLTISPVRNSAGRVVAASTIAWDITERKRSEESIRKLLRAVEQSENAIFMTDPGGRITYVNPAFEKIYGYSREESIGKTPRILKSGKHDAGFYAAFWRRLLAGETVRGEIVNQRKDGRLVTVEESVNSVFDADGRRIGFIAVQDDVTERRLLESQFRQAQKMEAVGQLAGGVAHDFNNLLTAILGNVELLSEELGRESNASELIAEIRGAGERAAALTRQLLAFSRKQILEFRVLDLNELVRNFESLLARLLGEDVELAVRLDPNAGRVRADWNQIEQVIMNLAVNARDAMPRGGVLTIETLGVTLDEEYAREHATVVPGPQVMLAVSDTGVGMTEETKARVFEPFFTTKGMGRGTGLGLATVYGIVKQSGGHIWLYSERGKGTTFKVYFPRVEEPASAARPHHAMPPARGGNETILLVEDERGVRTLCIRLLKSRGYNVLEAASAEEALEKARSHDGPIHLLLTDVVMPDTGGADLASRVAKLRPAIKLLYMSGYTDEAISRKGLLAEGVHFLQKPFTPEALAEKVREALES